MYGCVRWRATLDWLAARKMKGRKCASPRPAAPCFAAPSPPSPPVSTVWLVCPLSPRPARRPRSDAGVDLLASAARTPLGGPEGNARLTGATAALLLVLLAAEGLTVLQVRSLLTPHVAIGMVLIPFVAVKIASTGWRMVRYYQGDATYRARGAPPLLLRLLGPALRPDGA